MKVFFHLEAAAELKDAAAFYAQRGDRELGLAFLGEVERAVSLLQHNPELGAEWRSTARRLPMRRFPYSLVYRLRDGGIQILAIAHHRRRPGYWRQRR